MKSELVIVGIDPGTTLGYAVFSMDGTIIAYGSSKTFTLNTLIKHITSVGRCILVGTDKKKVPDFIDKFRVKVGAKVFAPSVDIPVREKRQMTEDYVYKNSHEMDAIAAALFAYSKVMPLITKVQHALAHRSEQFDTIFQTVFLKEISIDKAIASLKEKPVKQRKEKVVPEVDPKVLKLNREIMQLKKMNTVLKRQNEKLRKENNKLQVVHTDINKKVKRLRYDENKDKILMHREDKIMRLYSTLKAKDDRILELERRITHLGKILADIGSYVVVKKLDTLGYREFLEKNEVLDIAEDDVLYIADATVISTKTLEALPRVTILYGTKAPASLKERFSCLKHTGFYYEGDLFFGFIKKKQFEKQKNDILFLQDIVTGYQKRHDSV